MCSEYNTNPNNLKIIINLFVALYKLKIRIYSNFNPLIKT